LLARPTDAIIPGLVTNLGRTHSSRNSQSFILQNWRMYETTNDNDDPASSSRDSGDKNQSSQRWPDRHPWRARTNETPWRHADTASLQQRRQYPRRARDVAAMSLIASSSSSSSSSSLSSPWRSAGLLSKHRENSIRASWQGRKCMTWAVQVRIPAVRRPGGNNCNKARQVSGPKDGSRRGLRKRHQQVCPFVDLETGTTRSRFHLHIATTVNGVSVCFSIARALLFHLDHSASLVFQARITAVL
jgi:hypothetical protein